jgi:ADP-ribose pyrophosphatase YjhB (NUDIX family)
MNTLHPLHLFAFCPLCGSPDFLEHNFKAKHCANCGFIYYFNASAATVAVITDTNGRLLVTTRAFEPAKGTSDLPGGFVDLHETLEECMTREVLEETGLQVEAMRYLFSLSNRYVYSGFEVETADAFFLCRVSDFSKMKASDDVANLKFVEKSQLRPEEFGLQSVRKGIEKIITEKLI